MAIAIRGSNGTTSAIQVNGTDVITINDSTGVVDIVNKEYNIAPPIGAGYTRYPGAPLPEILYPGTTWTKISSAGNLNGTFPRFEGTYSGHEACVYDTVYTSQNKSHTHSYTMSGMSANANHVHNSYVVFSNEGGNVNQNFRTKVTGTVIGNSAQTTNATSDITHSHSAPTFSSDGGTEARPVCVGIQHYRRSA